MISVQIMIYNWSSSLGLNGKKFPKMLILAFEAKRGQMPKNIIAKMSGTFCSFQLQWRQQKVSNRYSVGQLPVPLALNHGKNLSRLVLLSTLLKSCTIISRGVLECWDDLGQSKAGGCCWSAQLDRKWKNSAEQGFFKWNKIIENFPFVNFLM